MDNKTKETIMVVDDTPANLKLLTEMLRAQGYRMLAFPRGSMALTAAAKTPPDLILLDINMPEMNGFEVCRRLKADESLKDIPVIFITAMIETSDKMKAFAVGGVDYVTKPFEFEEVHARVKTHLSILSLQRQLRAHNENLERVVEERTRELSQAHERLRELSRIKDDFLQMISYELRTPANGVLGIGELIIDLCPDTEECAKYCDMFRGSSMRLLNLIDDATMIADMENLTMKTGGPLSFDGILDKVKSSLANIRISMEQQGTADSFFLRGESTLMKKAIETMILLATFFLRDRQEVHIKGTLEEQYLRLRIDVDALSLSKQQTGEFFGFESSVRATTPAESLGLAPVTAHKIITAFGGEMRLVRGEGKTGYIEALLLREPGVA